MLKWKRGIASALAAASVLACIGCTHASAQTPAAQNEQLLAIYKQLVEIDTSATTGSCTRAVEAMAVRFAAAGFAPEDVHIVTPENTPSQGNLVVRYRGSGEGALLLLAHIDVVDARPEDWSRDPFALTQEGDFYYGRGTADDKAMAAIFVDVLIALHAEGFRPRRDIKLALTCGEETPLSSVNGVEYLLQHHRALLDADFALNEGAGGVLDASGRPVMLEVQAGEKIPQTFVLETRNPGGHSSRPRSDNAIYALSAALLRLEQHQFAVDLNPVTRAQFRRMASDTAGEQGEAMAHLANDPSDTGAAQLLSQDPSYNALLRTTCVATQLEAGHAPNALAQRARATVSCRILPGQSVDDVERELVQTIADPSVQVSAARRSASFAPPPLSDEIMAPIEASAARMWPGVPVAPSMLLGATDGRFLNAAGIPTYGLSGVFSVPGENNAHGADERLRVRSLFEGREFLMSVTRAYAGEVPR